MLKKLPRLIALLPCGVIKWALGRRNLIQDNNKEAMNYTMDLLPGT